jgi:hypothetical protein
MTERTASNLRAGSAIGMAICQLERDTCSKTLPLIAAASLAIDCVGFGPGIYGVC